MLLAAIVWSLAAAGASAETAQAVALAAALALPICFGLAATRPLGAAEDAHQTPGIAAFAAATAAQ
jgi:Flp pilus assembly protein protease CpaA